MGKDFIPDLVAQLEHGLWTIIRSSLHLISKVSQGVHHGSDSILDVVLCTESGHIPDFVDAESRQRLEEVARDLQDEGQLHILSLQVRVRSTYKLSQLVDGCLCVKRIAECYANSFLSASQLGLQGKLLLRPLL